MFPNLPCLLSLNVGKRALFLVSDFTLQHLQKSILKRLQRNNSGDPALGALTMPNGGKYVGEFRDGKPNDVITWDQGQPAAAARFNRRNPINKPKVQR